MLRVLTRAIGWPARDPQTWANGNRKWRHNPPEQTRKTDHKNGGNQTDKISGNRPENQETEQNTGVWLSQDMDSGFESCACRLLKALNPGLGATCREFMTEVTVCHLAFNFTQMKNVFFLYTYTHVWWQFFLLFFQSQIWTVAVFAWDWICDMSLRQRKARGLPGPRREGGHYRGGSCANLPPPQGWNSGSRKQKRSRQWLCTPYIFIFFLNPASYSKWHVWKSGGNADRKRWI